MLASQLWLVVTREHPNRRYEWFMAMEHANLLGPSALDTKSYKIATRLTLYSPRSFFHPCEISYVLPVYFY